MRKLTHQLRKQHELNIANQPKSNPKVFWRFARNPLRTRIGVAPLIFNPDDPAILKHSDQRKGDIIQSQFCLVCTREPKSEITQLERHSLQTVELSHRSQMLCKLCRTFPSPTMGTGFTVFWASRPCGPAGWLTLLLTKAGDVETNPGPTT